MMTTSIDKIKANYPLHYLVWQNEPKELEKVILEEKVSSRIDHVLPFLPTLSPSSVNLIRAVPPPPPPPPLLPKKK